MPPESSSAARSIPSPDPVPEPSPQETRDPAPPARRLTTPTSSQTLLRLQEHARSWGYESAKLEGVWAELDRFEATIHARVNESRLRLQEIEGEGDAIQKQGLAGEPASEALRHRRGLLLLRQRVARRDVLQSERDLDETGRMKRDVEKAIRAARSRAEGFEEIAGTAPLLPASSR